MYNFNFSEENFKVSNRFFRSMCSEYGDFEELLSSVCIPIYTSTFYFYSSTPLRVPSCVHVKTKWNIPCSSLNSFPSLPLPTLQGFFLSETSLRFCGVRGWLGAKMMEGNCWTLLWPLIRRMSYTAFNAMSIDSLLFRKYEKWLLNFSLLHI